MRAASTEFVAAGVVELLEKRPELRDLFPLADAVDQAVRA